MPERILELSKAVSTTATRKVGEIQKITATTRILALNATIEAARAGDAGKGFAIVAGQVRAISENITKISKELTEQMGAQLEDLNVLGRKLVTQIRGQRLADLALNMIDIIDRNLYERSCDVRWWATDSAMVNCLQEPTDDNAQYASKRMGVILGAYTVYLDLWIADRHGRVVANGRPDKYPGVKGINVSGENWFKQAMATSTGDEFAVNDIAKNTFLDDHLVATYSAAIRQDANPHGEPIGVLGIFFDWQAQSQAVVDSVRLADDEKGRTCCLLLDHDYRVIASTDGKGILEKRIPLKTDPRSPSGSYSDNLGNTIGYALTPGYETYKGLGWYGCIIQSAAVKKDEDSGEGSASVAA